MLVLVALFASSCEDDVPRDVSVDLGTIAHGARAETAFDLAVPAACRDLSPIGVELDCSCTTAETTRDANGTLRVRLRVDSLELPAADQESEVHHGAVLFDLGRDEPERVAFAYRFAVHSDFRLVPAATFDFGRIAKSTSITRTIRFEIEREKGIQVRAARSDDARVVCELDVEPEGVVVRATFAPDATARTGLFGTEVVVATTREGYDLRVPVRAVVVEAANEPVRPR